MSDSKRTPFSSPRSLCCPQAARQLEDDVRHFASFGFGPFPAVTNGLRAAGEKQPLSVQGLKFRKWLAVSPIMSGMMFFCWASSWMCSSITPSTIIMVQGTGSPPPPVFFFPGEGVLMEGDTRRLARAWLPAPCTLVFAQYVLGCSSSTSSLAHSMVGPAQRPSFCFPLSLWSCMKEVSPGRHVYHHSSTQDDCSSS